MRRLQGSGCYYLLHCLWPSLAVLGCSLFETEVPQTKPTCVDGLDVAKEAKFDLDSEAAARLQATLMATVELAQFSAKLDTDLSTYCLNLAREVGTGELPEVEGPEASCELAAKRIRKSRQDSGTTLVVDLKPPTCTARPSDYQRCAKDCDFNLQPDATIACSLDTESGRCDSKCTGQCIEIQTDDCKSECRGTCQGRCMDGFFGVCGGKCIGDCDGKTVSGKCEGTCDGKCTSQADGACEKKCQGKCVGACLTEKKAGKCDGTCAGTCKDPMSDTRCAQMAPPAEMSPACRARCDADLSQRQMCVAGEAAVTVFSSADRDKGERLRASLARTFSQVLNLEHGTAPLLTQAAEGLTDSYSSLGAADVPKQTKQKLDSCLDAAQKKHDVAAKRLEDFGVITAKLVESTRN
jgi:hypothetical protein